MDHRDRRVAYFSMEVALESGIPTYSGGLGVLAGDTLRTAADLGLPVVAVSLVHRSGYFRQELDVHGQQREHDELWAPELYCSRLPTRVELDLAGRRVAIAAWRYPLRGVHGHEVPVLLLDTDLPENHSDDRRLTDHLYGGSEGTRLRQEAVLGIGGHRMLRVAGFSGVDTFHLNEGHAALVSLARIEEVIEAGAWSPSSGWIEQLRSGGVFTTHTPVPAGHDVFEPGLVAEVLGPARVERLRALGIQRDLHTTSLALATSGFTNAVSRRHAEVSRRMFPGAPIHAITNGIHPATWAAPAFQELFDRYVPEWRRDAFALRSAVSIPLEEIDDAHFKAKGQLLDCIEAETGERFEPEGFLIGFARRATAYKRADLLFRDPERLAELARNWGPLQIVFGGKAHPKDAEGKALIQRVVAAARALEGQVRVVYVPGYDMRLGSLLCTGCDLWLNTPIPPLEASGTSGMKAALNGVPSLSVLDGWWVEGCIEGVTGWAIGRDRGHEDVSPETLAAEHAESAYEKLDSVILPAFWKDRERDLRVRRQAIAINGPHFSTHRMMLEYWYRAYGAPSPTVV